MIKDITIPEIGEKVESGQVVEVLVKVGDRIQVEQGIVELETDKAVVEIPAEEAGTITEMLVKVGDTVKIGQVVAKLETADSGQVVEEPVTSEQPQMQPEVREEPQPEATPVQPAVAKAPAPVSTEKPPTVTQPEPPKEEPSVRASDIPVSPSVRRLARELGVDITKVAASGPGGRVTAEDVKNHVNRFVAGETDLGTAYSGNAETSDFDQWGEIERVALSQVRKLISAGTSKSWSTIPHVTQFDEADLTHTNEFVANYRALVEKKGGRLTITAVLIKVITAALQQFPRFNSSIDTHNDQLIFKKYYHIGIAVDTDRGLLVPVLRDANKKGIAQLAIEMGDLAERTRQKKVKPDELDGGTFTISNQGGIGGTNFTPIVLWPQAAILGVSRTAKRLVEIEGEIVSRPILPLSLSYDHRIIDGADAARFLRWIKEALEHPMLMQLEV